MRMIIGFILICCTAGAHAGEARGGEQVYVDTAAYIAQAFAGQPPEQDTLWPAGELRTQLTGILGHAPSLRFKYWGANGRTVWILDEIGKERPITAGVTVDQGRIADVQVLVFRESRGWEVKYDFFTRQFANLGLNQRRQLSGSVDNITGATLSVKAMTRMARAALLMHQHTDQATLTVANAR